MDSSFVKLATDTEVDQYAFFALFIVQYILWFYISMADMFPVNIVQSFDNLVDDTFEFLCLMAKLPLHLKIQFHWDSGMADNPLPVNKFPSTCQNKTPCT